MTLPLLSIGAKGVVSVASHLVGLQLQQMIQAFCNGKVKIARDIHLKLFPLFKVLFATANPIPIKTALQLQGWEVGSTRLPLYEAELDFTQQLAATLEQLDLSKV
jgi:4-hydroxy-tetrahydrodipicolinate synthase